MSRNLGRNLSNISNEQILLIDILNSMYNDNIRQIHNYNRIVNDLNEKNNYIRHLLIQILNTSRRNNSNTNTNTNTNANTNANSNTNTNRQSSQNQNYIIDSLYDFTIPLSDLTALFGSSRDSNTRTTNDSRYLESFFSPIEIYPTQSQIEAATRVVRYSDIVSPINTNCPISMEPFNDNNMVTVIRHCGHIFNSDNFNTWFRSNCRCPVCRYDIRSYNSNTSSQFFNSSEQNNSRSRGVTGSTEYTSRPVSTQNRSQNNNSNVIEERNNNTRRSPSSLLINSLFTSLLNNYQDLSGNVLL